MSNTYLTTNSDVNAAYQAQAAKDDGMSADEFSQWHWANYGQNEHRDGWGGGSGPAPEDPAAAGMGMLGRAGMGIQPMGAGQDVVGDSWSGASAAIAPSPAGGMLGSFLRGGVSGSSAPAAVGYLADPTVPLGATDSGVSIGAEPPAGGAAQQATKSYLQENPDVASDYWNGADGGMTLDEYTIAHWQKNGGKDGYNISKTADGRYAVDAPKVDIFKSKFTEDEQRAFAKIYLDESFDHNNFSSSGLRRVMNGMETHGISTQELAAAVQKYGAQYERDNRGVHSPKHISDLIAREAENAGLAKGFGGESAKNMPAVREPTAKEMEIIEWARAMDGAGSYRSQNGSNVPSEIRTASAALRGSPFVTQEELINAKRIVDGGSAQYVGKNGEWSDALTNQNWRQDLQQNMAQEKAYWRAKYDAQEGKISPFVSGPATKNTTPSTGWGSVRPGLGSLNGQTVATPRPAQAPAAQSSAAFTAAAAIPNTPVINTSSSAVNQNDLGVIQKYAAQIKSSPASQALYSSYKQDLAKIDANASLSMAQKDAAKKQAAANIERLLLSRRGA